MQIKFCGAAREVTGSCHLLTLESGYTILLDCGLYQGRNKEMKDFNDSFLFDPGEVDCMILSHAHIDHAGRVPKLVKDGYRGDIYCTHATRSLSAIMLIDSAKIQERDAEYFNKRQLSKPEKHRKPLREPLYRQGDVRMALGQFVSLNYDKWHRINDKVSILFKDAGHILGSASVALRIEDGGREFTVGFSGDVGRPNRPILRDPERLPTCDYMLIESTYGDKNHIDKPAENDKLLEIIHRACVEKKGKLIIPAFSVGRTQEIVYMLDQLETAERLPRIPVYVDSPLAVNATLVFGNHPECFDKDLHDYMIIDDNPFGFNNLTYIHDVAMSKALNQRKEPCIIISASGMANAGRVKHHLFNSIESPKNTVLIVGYCAPGTPGGILRNGGKHLYLFGEHLNVNATVEIMDSFSAHADRDELLDFLGNQQGKTRKLFLVHGEHDTQEKFRDYLRQNGFTDVEIPELGQEFRLT